MNGACPLLILKVTKRELNFVFDLIKKKKEKKEFLFVNPGSRFFFLEADPATKNKPMWMTS